MMLVDETLALYLFKTSLQVNEKYYKNVLIFVLFFREFLNKIGWKLKLTKNKIEDDK